MDAPYDATTGHPDTISFRDVSTGFGRIGVWLAERRKIGRLTRELNRYSDRDLGDMGLTRGDIPAVARGRFPRG